MTDATPLGDKLVLIERDRVLGLAVELERHGKLTASTLRSFSEMQLQVVPPRISVTQNDNGSMTARELHAFERRTAPQRLAHDLDNRPRCSFPRRSFTAGDVGCGDPVMTDRHGFYESMCPLHLVEHLKQELRDGPDDTQPEDSADQTPKETL